MSEVEKVEKATAMDKGRYLRRALSSSQYMIDFDDEYVYFDEYEYSSGTYEIYRAKYSVEGVNANIEMSGKEKVDSETTYVKKSAIESVVERALNKFFGDAKGKQKTVIKMFDEEQMIVTEPLYVAYGEVDAHRETYKSKEDLFGLVESFNKAIEAKTLKSSYFHSHWTESFESVKAWVNEEEAMLGDSLIPALQPLVEVKFKTEKAFELRKSMDFLGVSIGCKAVPVDKDGKVLSKSVLLEDLDPSSVVYLTNFDFEYEGAHLAYTDKSAGGAASMKNEYYAIKSKNKAQLSEEQKRLLAEAGEEFRPLDKSVMPNPASSSVEDSQVGEEGENVNKNGNVENPMSEVEKQLKEQLEALEKSNRELKAQVINKELESLGVKEEVSKELSDILVAMSEQDRSVIVKAISSVKAEVKEVETKVSELQKQLKESKELDDAADDLTKEIGAEEDPSKTTEKAKDLKSRVEAARQERAKGSNKENV